MKFEVSLSKPKWINKLAQHGSVVAWLTLALLDAVAVVYTYWGEFVKLLHHDYGKYCYTLPINALVERLFQPRYFFLILSILLFSVSIVRVATLPTVRLYIKRVKLAWLSPALLLALLLATIFLITKFTCWR